MIGRALAYCCCWVYCVNIFILVDAKTWSFAWVDRTKQTYFLWHRWRTCWTEHSIPTIERIATLSTKNNSPQRFVFLLLIIFRCFFSAVLFGFTPCFLSAWHSNTWTDSKAGNGIQICTNRRARTVVAAEKNWISGANWISQQEDTALQFFWYVLRPEEGRRGRGGQCVSVELKKCSHRCQCPANLFIGIAKKRWMQLFRR